MFEVEYKISLKFLGKNKIESYFELRQVFIDRYTRVFPNWDLDESIFFHYLIGAIEHYRKFNGFKPTLVKFEVENKCDYFPQPIRYYTIFNPLRGWISDGSHWLVFRNNSEQITLADALVEKILEEHADELDYFEYVIDESLMKKYLSKKTYGTERETRDIEIKKASRGLLGEFLAALYILKDYGLEKLLALDVHRQIQDTDIDVFAETIEQVIVGQVKSNISFKWEDTSAILKNFEKISYHLQTKTKKQRRILFLMRSEILNSEKEPLPIDEMCDEEFEDGMTIKCVDNFFERKKQEIENYFKQHNVEMIFLDDIVEKLGTEKCYRDLINKLTLILTEEKFNPFDQEFFLWLDNYKLLLNHPDS